jgi:hypothetical protein
MHGEHKVPGGKIGGAATLQEAERQAREKFSTREWLMLVP